MASPASSSSTVTTASPPQKRIHLPTSPPRSTPSISKTYKLASELFLTRRLRESYILVTTLTDPDTTTDSTTLSLSAARPTLHAKVWVLYLCLLNSIIDLGSTEGSQLFSSTQYRAIVEQVRDGSVWENVVQRGYDGELGSVDSSVIFNLITLSLAHATTQRDTQSRIEMYLASSSSPSNASQTSLADSPTTLKHRVRILELFALHVLPRNEEWQYSRDLIRASELLDEEQRDHYLQALDELQHLKEDRHGSHVAEITKKAQAVDQPEPVLQSNPKPQSEPKPPASQQTPKTPSTPKPLSTNTHIQTQSPSNRRSHPQRPTQPAAPAPAPLSLLTQVQALVTSTLRTLQSLTSPLRTNPLAMLRVLVSLVAIVMVFGQREVRERVRRVLARGWGAVGGTVRMGVSGGYM